MPLRQIFQNLMNNAVKHHGGHIGQISVTGRDVGNTLEFTVADDGQGIDEMYHEKIFEMFQTLKRRDEVEASGMGLAIVKKIILRNGGNIRVLSESGTGSKFIFTWQKPTGTAND